VTSGWLGTAEGRRMIEDVQSEVPGLRHVISAEGGTGAHWGLADLLSTEPDSSFRPPNVSPDDLLALLYTSGTTGVPKGTMHSHRSLMTPVIASLKIRELWRIRPSLATMERFAKALARYGERLLRAAGRPQTLLSIAEFHTPTGLEVMLQALLMGDKLVIMPRFHPQEALELIECAMHIGFGTTELAGGIAATSLEDSEDLQAETVGQAMPGMEIKIVDDERRELPPGQVGELACRSDSVMMGYWRAPDRTAEVVDEEGWYYTGDLATIDERGTCASWDAKKT
jgi:fatty-acyl-CoA synthase